MKTLVVIPARYGSTRFPGKVLATLRGKPILQYPYEAAMASKLVSEVLIATDSEEVVKVAKSFGARAVMTSPEHPSGTDRVAEVAGPRDVDIVVNLQADEPLIRTEMIDSVIKLLLDDPEAEMGTLAKELSDSEEVFNPNVVKVVTDHRDYALYFSRAPIPYYRDLYIYKGHLAFETTQARALKHIGIYSYRKETLLKLTSLPQSPPEVAEKLEQLRALYNGIKLKVALTEYDTIGVDTPEDLERLKEIFSNR
ncbi:MAG: 3-deoxy-manno-octulosonate cytidylyltransferase [Nitrospirae bacterium]|nr:MAG: 3-deoxy-manno-octulosonate cytidylyltransferase [Nitrospirota bacterium]